MKKELSFEEALKELEEIVVNLEKGDISLDDAIKAYEKGSLLKEQCEKRLNEAKLKVEEIEEKENKKSKYQLKKANSKKIFLKNIFFIFNDTLSI